jgi:hypothetical protein
LVPNGAPKLVNVRHTLPKDEHRRASGSSRSGHLSLSFDVSERKSARQHRFVPSARKTEFGIPAREFKWTAFKCGQEQTGLKLLTGRQPLPTSMAYPTYRET